MQAGLSQYIQCFMHCRTGGTVIDCAKARRVRSRMNNRLGYFFLGGFKFMQKTLHVVDIRVAFLGVTRITIAAGSAGEIAALGGVRAWIGTERNTVAIHIEIATEILACIKVCSGHHLAAIHLSRVIPLEGLA